MSQFTIMAVLMAVMWPTIMIALALLWRRTDVLAAARSAAPPARPPDPLLIGKINEEPLPAGKASLEFWQGLHRLQAWTVLSHIYQADTRNYLREAKDAAASGNQAGALFWAGKAHEAAFNAVRPEAQVQRITQALVAQQQEQLRQAQEPASATTGGRPGERWSA